MHTVNWFNKYTGRRVRLHARMPNPAIRVFDMFDRDTGALIETFELRRGEQLRSRMAFLGYVA